MAEFDSTGFSPVAAFFGGRKTEDAPRDEAKHRPTSLAVISSKKSGRQGVGSLQAHADATTSSIAAKRVLAVGKRRRLDQDQEDDDESHDDRSVGEEEEGRTAIANKKSSVAIDNSMDTEPPRKKKKKKGKKERQAEADSTDLHSETEVINTSKPSGEEEEEADKERILDKTKRKSRHKVRSRQKNIYKDKRLAQHKPDHLILGRPDFAGRPLTPATRAKLKLPPSRSSRKHLESSDPQETEQNLKPGDGEGMKLAIDELLDDVGEPQEEEPATALADSAAHKKPLRKLKSKKKKKSKYKNLQQLACS